LKWPAAACSCRILHDDQVALGEGGRELLRNGYGGQAKVPKFDDRRSSKKDDFKKNNRKELLAFCSFMFILENYTFLIWFNQSHLPVGTCIGQ
jgi:hypothetical protein